MSNDAIRDEFYTALKAAGLGHMREQEEPIVFHDLRHTFGTLGAAVWPLRELQGYLGHADIQTAMIYVHHVPKVAAADELTRAVEAATSPTNGHPSEGADEAIVSRTVSRTAQFEATQRN